MPAGTTPPPPPPACTDKLDSTAPSSGATINVAAGADLQAAIDRANPGDVIVLAAGAVFAGSYHLPNKSGSAYITLRTSALDKLPPPGTRVSPASASAMAKIVGTTMGDAPLLTDPGAHHYRLIGLEIAGTPNTYTYNVVALGSGYQTQLSQVPHDFVLDRMYIHGDVKAGVMEAVALNSGATTIINSWISDAKSTDQEAQAIAGTNGPGPYNIINNHLEGSAQNIMFGGEDPLIQNLVPSDIVIKWNHFTKPLSWKPTDPSYAGTHWWVKNLFELKNARRVTIDGNLFEYSWQDGQSGEVAIFTVRNQNGAAPWSTVESVSFTNNLARHTGGGLSILGHDDNNPSQLGHDFTISNNFFYDIGGTTWGGWGRFLDLDSGTTAPGPANVRVDHNTVVQVSDVLVGETPGVVVDHPGLVFTNNLTMYGPRGVWGDSTASGDPSLAKYFSAAVFTGNALVGATAASFTAHPGNQFPASMALAGLADPTSGRLSATSPLVNAGTDGKNVGVDTSALDAAAACRTP